MAKDPAILFYTSDFISGTITMTDEQRGKYILLLCLQHQQGFLTDEDMLNICKTYDKKIYSKFVKEGDVYFNQRMKIEMDKRLKYSESRRNNRNGKNISKSYVQHMENENENINKDIIKNIINVPFEKFWDLYDKKVDRKKCESKWVRLTDSERDECIKKIPAYIQATPDKKFRRDPETYINNKSWENEIISPFPAKLPEQPLTYEEMCNKTQNDPEIWKRYKAVKREGERKAVFVPITKDNEKPL
jgi:uncharacterized protein YdaU (DUF1376 family)